MMRPDGKATRRINEFFKQKSVITICLCAFLVLFVVVGHTINVSNEAAEERSLFDISVASVEIEAIEDTKRLCYTFIVDNSSKKTIKNLSIAMQPCQELHNYLRFGCVVVPLGTYDLMSKEDAIRFNDAYGVNCSCSLQLKEQGTWTTEDLLESAKEATLFLKWDGGEETHMLSTFSSN